MAETYPIGLPTTYLQQDFSEGIPDIVLKSTTDSGGIYKTRLKATGGYAPVTLSLSMNSSQKATFDNWYINTLKFGTLPALLPLYSNPAETMQCYIVSRAWQPLSGKEWILKLVTNVLILQD